MSKEKTPFEELFEGFDLESYEQSEELKKDAELFQNSEPVGKEIW